MSVFIRKVQLENYRSIHQCEVDLGPVTFLVGANGSGKSNFIDALRLITDALNRSLDHALRDRGGLEEVRRRSGGHPTHFGIRVDFDLDGRSGHFSFKVGAKRQKTWSISREECRYGSDFYSVEEGTIRAPVDQRMPPAQRDRIYLVTAASRPEFRPVYDALSQMPKVARATHEPWLPRDPGPGAVLGRLRSRSSDELPLVRAAGSSPGRVSWAVKQPSVP